MLRWFISSTPGAEFPSFQRAVVEPGSLWLRWHFGDAPPAFDRRAPPERPDYRRQIAHALSDSEPAFGLRSLLKEIPMAGR
jgi:hypothetical protein